MSAKCQEPTKHLDSKRKGRELRRPLIPVCGPALAHVQAHGRRRRNRLVHGVDQTAEQTVHVVFGRIDCHAQHVTAADLVEFLDRNFGFAKFFHRAAVIPPPRAYKGVAARELDMISAGTAMVSIERQ
jgi:hypothetical protein